MECDDEKDHCTTIEDRKHYSIEFLLKLRSHPLSCRIPPTLPERFLKRKKNDHGAKPKSRQHHQNLQNRNNSLSLNERVLLAQTLPDSRNYFNERVTHLGSPNLWSSSRAQENLRRGRKFELSDEAKLENIYTPGLHNPNSPVSNSQILTVPKASDPWKPRRNMPIGREIELSDKAKLENIHTHGLHNPNSPLSNSQILTVPKASDPWKPRRNMPIGREIEIGKNVRGILNKLTKEKSTTLRMQLRRIEIDTESKLRTVVDVIFESAAVNSKYNFLYADVCASLEFKSTSLAERVRNISFKEVLFNKCKMWYKEDATGKWNENEERQKVLNDINEIERRNQRRKGIICFIAELFKKSILPDDAILDIIDSLLKKDDEIALECLCQLFVKIGKKLTNMQLFGIDRVRMTQINEYICRMQDIADRQKISPRVKFMLQNVEDLKENDWNPRKTETDDQSTDDQNFYQSRSRFRFLSFKEEQSKKLEIFNFTDRLSTFNQSSSEPHDDADLSKRYLALANSTSVPSVIAEEHEQNQNYISHSAETSDTEMEQMGIGIFKEEVKGRNPNYEPDGWITTNKTSKVNCSVDPSKLQSKSAQPDTVQLGPARGFFNWGRGSSAPVKPTPEAKVPNVTNVNGEGASATMLKGPELSEDEIEKKTKPLMDEFLRNADFEETVRCITELASPTTIHHVITAAINHILERSCWDRYLLGQLLHNLVQSKLIVLEQYNKGLTSILQLVDVYALDIPLIWDYLAEIIEPMMEGGDIPMSFLAESLRPCSPSITAGKLVAAILHCASKKRGTTKVGEMWKDSGLQWNSFLPPSENLTEFTKTYDVEFTISQMIVKPVTIEMPSATEIKTKLDFYLKNDSQNNEQIFNWIKSHIGANIGEPTFIRALVTAVFENAISGSVKKCEINADKLKSRMPIIHHYVAQKDEAELQTLYALQALILRLNQPKGILNQAFDTLYDEEIIREETFDKWETSQDPAEQDGKGVAVNSVCSFFTWLREDEDNESSTEDG